MNVVLDLIGVALVIVATLLIGVYGLRISRTTGDFFVASRTVRPVWNASAISGEYLSAGTFLGLSGLVLLDGARGFWFPIGYAAGYLLVLAFVAARSDAAAPTRSPTSSRRAWSRRRPDVSRASRCW